MSEKAPRPWDDVDTMADFRRTLGRLVDRFGRMTERQLTAFAGGRTRAEAARELAGRLADYAVGIERRAAPEAPPRMRMPDVGPFSVADQLAVTGRDLILAYDDLTDRHEQVWHAGVRRPACEVAADALARVEGFDRSLS